MLTHSDNPDLDTWVDISTGRLVGRRVGDLVQGGDIGTFVVSDRFVEACAGLTGLSFGAPTVYRTSAGAEHSLRLLVVEGASTYEHERHLSPDDFTMAPHVIYPDQEMLSYRGYRPAPQDWDGDDVFRNVVERTQAAPEGGTVTVQDNTVWMTQTAADQLAAADLENVRLIRSDSPELAPWITSEELPRIRTFFAERGIDFDPAEHWPVETLED